MSLPLAYITPSCIAAFARLWSVASRTSFTTESNPIALWSLQSSKAAEIRAGGNPALDERPYRQVASRPLVAAPP